MLALPSTPKPNTHTRTLTPNILPCRIHHSGPIPTSKHHWNPSKITKDSPTATTTTQSSYLRGRKLLGKSVKLPSTYTGVVLQKTEKVLPQPAKQREDDGEEEDGDEPVEVKMMETIGRFEEVVVWGHEMVPEEGEDVYVKGLQEWIGFAETVGCGLLDDAVSL